MKILILGGTNFVGRLCAMEAIARGHQVTIFNRGNRPIPGGATEVIGDRLKPDGYKNLEGMSFDTVIDTWATDAEAVTSAVDALRGKIGQYIYISTVSVYETAATGRPFTEDSKLFDPETAYKYAKDKILGEIEAQKSGVPTLLPRPGVILGPHENTPGRMPWWLRRMERGGPTLGPGPPELGIQFIDGRDLANFTIDGAEAKREGAYNINSPIDSVSFKAFLDKSNEVAGGKATLYWLEPEKIKEAGIKPWGEMPMWWPPGDRPAYSVDSSKAENAGLRARSAGETISDAWDWLKSWDVPESPPGVGLDPDKELATLKKYFDGI